MKRIIPFSLLLLVSCASGPNPKNQVNPQTGYSKGGNVNNLSAQGDLYQGNAQVTINNFGKLNEDQLRDLLEQKTKEIDEMKKQISELQPTKFVIKKQEVVALENGKFKALIHLIPEGKSAIAIFTVSASIKNSGKIEDIKFTGPAFGAYMSQSSSNQERTLVSNTVNNVPPLEVTVEVTANGLPDDLSIFIDPLKL